MKIWTCMRKWPLSVFMNKSNQNEGETTICFLGSDRVVNSFKNSEQTEDIETKYLCPAVIFAFCSFYLLFSSFPLQQTNIVFNMCLLTCCSQASGSITKHMACNNKSNISLASACALNMSVISMAGKGIHTRMQWHVSLDIFWGQ